MAWEGSTRRQRLPPDWEMTRRRILRRDPVCRLRMCCSGAPSTQVDHVIAGDNHHPGNLAGVCEPCHRAKSAAEGVEGRKKLIERRKPERHPGLNDGM